MGSIKQMWSRFLGAYVNSECYPKGRKLSDAAWRRLDKLWLRFIWDSFYVIQTDLEGPEALKAYLDKTDKDGDWNFR